jgi:hypothetical protein
VGTLVQNGQAGGPNGKRSHKAKYAGVFWGSLANAAGASVAEREVAVYAVRMLLGETKGQKRACQAVETIRGEVTVADILRILDRYSGSAGQQLLMRKAGY